MAEKDTMRRCLADTLRTGAKAVNLMPVSILEPAGIVLPFCGW